MFKSTISTVLLLLSCFEVFGSVLEKTVFGARINIPNIDESYSPVCEDNYEVWNRLNNAMAIPGKGVLITCFFKQNDPNSYREQLYGLIGYIENGQYAFEPSDFVGIKKKVDDDTKNKFKNILADSAERDKKRTGNESNSLPLSNIETVAYQEKYSIYAYKNRVNLDLDKIDVEKLNVSGLVYINKRILGFQFYAYDITPQEQEGILIQTENWLKNLIEENH